jgi:hypothetical protein
MKSHKRFISILLLLAMISAQSIAIAYPQPAHAATIKGTGISFTSCYVGGVLSSVISKQIDKQLTKVVNKVTDLLSNKVDKAIDKAVVGGLNFVAGLFGFKSPFSTTQSTDDKNTQAAIRALIKAQADKAYRDDVIARCIARTVLQNMITNINQLVRTSGRDGGPTYVQNWVKFHTDAQYRGENIFRAELSTAHLCDYLVTDIKKTFGVDSKTKTPLTGQNTRTDSLQPFSLSTKCTLPTGFTPQKYSQDFAGNGGWDTFARLLEPQNNVYGLTAMSLDEISKQRALAVSADTSQVIANGGYTGISGSGKSDSCAQTGPNGQCLVYKNIKTPGSNIGANIAAGIQAEFDWITSAQQLGSIISTGLEVMLNRMLDFSNPDEGQYRLANDYNPTPEPLIILTPPPESGLATCTATGQEEQAFMLPLLNGSPTTPPQDVAIQTNTKFSLTTGSEAVYYSDSNTIGLPEFYLAGPTNRPDSPSKWTVVTRCTPQTSNTSGGPGPGNTTPQN